MKRIAVLNLVLGFGLASIVFAQAPRIIEVEKLKDNLFLLKGGGGNTTVFVTRMGVVVVDAKNPGWGQPILDKIKELTNKPITTLINTHTHGDHVSGNVDFPATVQIIAQENTKADMMKMLPTSTAQEKPHPPRQYSRPIMAEGCPRARSRTNSPCLRAATRSMCTSSGAAIRMAIRGSYFHRSEWCVPVMFSPARTSRYLMQIMAAARLRWRIACRKRTTRSRT